MSDADSVVLSDGEQADERDRDGESVAEAPRAKNRKPQFRFSPEMDELLLQETLAHNPFVAEFGAVTATWAKVAESLNVGIDGRRCRERVMTLVKNHKIRDTTSIRGSGLEEDVTDFDRMLYDITALQETQQDACKDRRQEKADTAADAERRGEEMRQLALEGMEYRGRKRAADSNIIEFLQAKETATKKARERELDIAEKKLVLEERQLALAEEKARLEAEERKALISLIAGLASKMEN